MVHRAIVTDIDDPKDLGRIKVRIRGFGENPGDTKHNVTPWVYPCTPLAGPGYGLFCMPVVGDEVLIVRTQESKWAYLGFFWSERHAKPEEGSPTPSVRVFRTPIGHQVKMEEDGCFEILHTNGNVIRMEANGDTFVNVNENATTNIGANSNVTIGDNSTLKIGSNSTTTIGGNAKVKVGGNARCDVGGKCDVKSGGNTTVKAPQIHLNTPKGGAVSTMCPCAITGAPHIGSKTVMVDAP